VFLFLARLPASDSPVFLFLARLPASDSPVFLFLARLPASDSPVFLFLARLPASDLPVFLFPAWLPASALPAFLFPTRLPVSDLASHLVNVYPASDSGLNFGYGNSTSPPGTSTPPFPQGPQFGTRPPSNWGPRFVPRPPSNQGPRFSQGTPFTPRPPFIWGPTFGPRPPSNQGPQFSPRPPFSWAPNLSQDPHPIGGPRSAPDPHFLGPPAPQPWAALELKTATLEKIVCVLNREVERLAAESAQERRREEERTEALTHKIRSLERNLALKEAGLAEVESALRRAEEATYDGVLIWKVEEVGWKRQEAVAGRASAIFSSAFYTSRYGYKMCLRLYLNGDGSGRNTHLSLFFVLMKGPNDALLKWPFNQKVTLMLLDQDHREHVIDAFRPDMTSSSFLRPIGALNVASGCPLFCPLSKMAARDSYIRDDTLFIKAIVDLTGL
uniref:MATH domain-containing protein n=1 Tax=Podarcis muralis TaxID=64176 RepID=A0A670HMN8_PODMU